MRTSSIGDPRSHLVVQDRRRVRGCGRQWPVVDFMPDPDGLLVACTVNPVKHTVDSHGGAVGCRQDLRDTGTPGARWTSACENRTSVAAMLLALLQGNREGQGNAGEPVRRIRVRDPWGGGAPVERKLGVREPMRARKGPKRPRAAGGDGSGVLGVRGRAERVESGSEVGAG